MIRITVCLVTTCLLIAGCNVFVSTDARMQRVRDAMYSGNYDRALTELNEAVRGGAAEERVAALKMRILLAQGKARDVLNDTLSTSGPLREPARSIARGAALAQLRQFTAAEVAYQSALAGDTSPYEAHVGLAEVLGGEGRLDASMAALDWVLAKDQRLARAWRARAAVFGRQGQFARMADALESAVRYAPGELDLPQQAQLLESLAQARLGLGNRAGAEAAYQQLISLAGHTPATDFVAGQLALAAGDYAVAATQLRSAVNNDQGLVRARLLLGRALLAQGDVSGAERQLTVLVQQTPRDREARKLLAKVRLLNGWAAGAAAVLTQMEHAASPDPEADELLSTAQMREGHDNEAIVTLERSSRESPHLARIQLLLAAAYLESGAAQTGASLLEDLRTDYLKDPVVLNQIASVWMTQGKFGQAQETLQAALAVDPLNVDAQLAEARIALQRSDDTLARAKLEAVCKADTKSTEAHLLLAELAFKNRRNPQGLQVLHEMLAAASRQDRLLDSAGHLLMDYGLFAEALDEFRAAVAQSPQRAAYWADVSMGELALNHPQAALEAASKAAALDPESASIVRIRVLVDLRAHRTDSALQTLESARNNQRVKDTPGAADTPPGEDTALWELEGDIRAARKEYSQAAAAFERAESRGGSASLAIRSVAVRRAAGLADPTAPLERWVARHPGDFAAVDALAQAYHADGQTADAIRLYETLVTQGSIDPAVFNNLAWLYQNSGNPKAIEVAHRAYELSPASPAIADTYGWALVQAGQAAAGSRILATATRDGAGEIRFHYAVALVKSGDRTKGRAVLTTLLGEDQAFSDRGEAERLLATL